MTTFAITAELQRFAELEKRRRELDAELKIVEAEQGTLEPAILEQFVNAGVSKITVSGLTVYLHSTLFAGLARQEGESADEAYLRACERLVALGLTDLVTTRFNAQSLAAVLREKSEEERIEFAKAAEGAIQVGEKTSLRARKAS